MTVKHAISSLCDARSLGHPEYLRCPTLGKRAADAAVAPPAKRGGGGRGAGRKPAKRGLGDGAVDADGKAPAASQSK